MRSGGWERSARDARSVPIVDTGASVAGPGRRASCRSSSRRWSTPASGRPPRSASRPSTRPTRELAARIERVEAPAEREERGRGAARRRRSRAPARRTATAPTTSRSRASAPGGRRSRSSTARSCGAGAGARGGPAGGPAARHRSRPARATRWPSAPTSSTSPARAAAAPPSARPTRSTATSTRSGSGCRPRCRPRTAPSRCSPTPTCSEWLPAERLVAGGDSGGFVFDQRIVTKALRDIGPFAFIEDGEPFAGCLFHEMVIADGRKMSKHLGNVVNPDELVERVRRRHGAARRPLRGRAGEDAELERRRAALRQPLPAQPLDLLAGPLRGARGRSRTTPRPPPTPSSCATACANGARTASPGSPRTSSELQMHKAVRNITRLFERIQDFEKRVVKRRGAARPRRRRGPGRGPRPAGAGAGAVRAARRRGAAARRRACEDAPSCRAVARVGRDPGRAGARACS